MIRPVTNSTVAETMTAHCFHHLIVAFHFPTHIHRRTDREAGEELRRRVDFDVDDDQPKGGAYDNDAYRSSRKSSAERRPSSDDDYQ